EAHRDLRLPARCERQRKEGESVTHAREATARARWAPGPLGPGSLGVVARRERARAHILALGVVAADPHRGSLGVEAALDDEHLGVRGLEPRVERLVGE